MKINVVIGAGQLGSRHLQGLLRLTIKQKIFVLDPSEVSLEVSKARANEIPNKHEIVFSKNWEVLPQNLDLVIIATGANVRAMLIEKLLPEYKVKSLVLEKILFQDLKSYEKIGEILQQTNTPTWVNHPRRMFSHYENIKNTISSSNEKVNFFVEGSNWGLACSTLHFIDIIAYLAGSSVSKIDMHWIDSKIHETKRANCIEFTGAVKGELSNGNHFVVSSLDGDLGEVTVMITTNSNRWIIHEGRAPKIIHLSKDSGFIPEIYDIVMEFQSTITTRIAQDLFDKATCSLPTYQKACESHLPFIKVALDKYNELTGAQTEICPIT